MNDSLIEEVGVLMRTCYNLERIGNAMANIAQHFENVMELDLPLSSQAWQEVDTISETVMELLDIVGESILEPQEDFFRQARRLEQRIDMMRAQMRQNHINRIQEERCQVDAGIAFMDILSRFEKIGDWSYNIAKGLMEVGSSETEPPEALSKMRSDAA